MRHNLYVRDMQLCLLYMVRALASLCRCIMPMHIPSWTPYFRTRGTDDVFCRNKYNATGMCSYRNCPLANSQYATVLEKDGKMFLNVKTIERAHLPKKLWEEIELSKNTKEALSQVCGFCHPNVLAHPATHNY